MGEDRGMFGVGRGRGKRERVLSRLCMEHGTDVGLDPMTLNHQPEPKNKLLE